MCFYLGASFESLTWTSSHLQCFYWFHLVWRQASLHYFLRCLAGCSYRTKLLFAWSQMLGKCFLFVAFSYPTYFWSPKAFPFAFSVWSWALWRNLCSSFRTTYSNSSSYRHPPLRSIPSCFSRPSWLQLYLVPGPYFWAAMRTVILNNLTRFS